MEPSSIWTKLIYQVQNTHVLFVQTPVTQPSDEAGGNAQGDGQGVCDRLNSSLSASLPLNPGQASSHPSLELPVHFPRVSTHSVLLRNVFIVMIN